MSKPKVARPTSQEEWLRRLGQLERAARQFGPACLNIPRLAPGDLGRLRASVPRADLVKALNHGVVACEMAAWAARGCRRQLERMLAQLRAEDEAWLRQQLGALDVPGDR
jgi:hypothetical protein